MPSPLDINGTTADGYCTTTLGPFVSTSTMLCGAASSDSADSDTAEWHAFCFFNTSALPNDSVVKKIEFGFRTTAVVGDASGFRLRAYIADNAIGTTLAKSDYGDVISAGELIATFTTTVGAKSHTSTTQAVLDEVSLTATTNIEFDAYFLGSPGSSGLISTIATQENATSSYRPYLKVWYTSDIEDGILQVMSF